jgi:hypothetical protein
MLFFRQYNHQMMSVFILFQDRENQLLITNHPHIILTIHERVRLLTKKLLKMERHNKLHRRKSCALVLPYFDHPSGTTYCCCCRDTSCIHRIQKQYHCYNKYDPSFFVNLSLLRKSKYRTAFNCDKTLDFCHRYLIEM